MTALSTRSSNHPVDPMFLARWSPRAFDGNALPVSDLLTLFEAARWAPSANNLQPWRFLYALPGDTYWATYVSLLDPFNASWAQHAGALVFLLADTESPTHHFDAGAAWSHLALQAHLMGYQAHAMAGILHDAIPNKLHVPDHLVVEIAIAIGAVGNPDQLPGTLRKRETPSSRIALEELVVRGRYR